MLGFNFRIYQRWCILFNYEISAKVQEFYCIKAFEFDFESGKSFNSEALKDELQKVIL